MTKQIGCLQPLPGWLNKLVIWFQLNDIKGGYTFYRFMRKYFSNRYVRYEFTDAEFVLPVNEWCFWLEGGPDNYYPQEFGPFCELLNKLDSFTFFDLGADIGTVSALVSRNCPQLKNILAFEPNPGSFSMLLHNINALSIPAFAVNQAVSDFVGKVSFASGNTHSGDHEGHILPDMPGDTPVTSIDCYLSETSLELSNTLVLKIDVEGQEVQTIKGALGTISSAAGVVLLLEIHPDVLVQQGQSPEDIFSQIEAMLQVNWFVPKFSMRAVDRESEFFLQFPQQQYDLIAITPSLAHLINYG